MKRLIILIIILSVLTACSSTTKTNTASLVAHGYSEEEAAIIVELGQEAVDIVLSYPYDGDIVTVMTDASFDADLLEEYLELDLDPEDRLMVVNNGYYSDSYDELTLELMRTDYYIHSRLDRYIAFAETLSDGYDYRYVVESVNCDRDYAAYEVILEADTSLGKLIIANKYYSIGDYVPDDLVAIDSAYGLSSYLDSEAYEHYVAMADAMAAEGLSVWITSAYRSYERQVTLYNSYLAYDSQEEVDTYSARPGHSDHQTGLVVDLILPGGDLGSFDGTDESYWLQEHAHEYGFILRYPEDKTDMTGYTYESWHYRYVGVEVATYIYETGITFDEYYAYFVLDEG